MTMVDGSGSGSSEAIVASQSIVSTWLIPIMWRAGTFIGGLFFLAVGALYYKQVSRPTEEPLALPEEHNTYKTP